jgi:hypothetical protein
MKKKKIKKTALDAISMSVVHIPSITSHSYLPYVSKAVYLGKEYK